jgi:hypothetical protein
MRAPFLTLGLSALLTIGVVLGFVGLRTQRTLDDVDAAPTPVVVTDVSIPAAPAPVTGPTETVLLRVYAPRGPCWKATIDGRPLRAGCGSTEFPLEVNRFVLVHVERMPSREGQVTAMIEVDGRVVQTVGPTSAKYPSFNIGYSVPESG